MIKQQLPVTEEHTAWIVESETRDREEQGPVIRVGSKKA